MPVLTVKNGNNEIKIEFGGTPILRDILAENGFAVSSPCGGKGICGKCAVDIVGNISEPDEREIVKNCRLACRTKLFGDAFVELKNDEYVFDNESGNAYSGKKSYFAGLGVAVDIGTTTVVLWLFDENGLLGEEQALNPQSVVSSDVIGRIDKALRGQGDILQKQIAECIDGLATRACENAHRSKDEIERVIITGNTAMMYLLTNRNPESISRYPFKAETLFGTWINKTTYLAPCMNAYVGGDITCAALSSGMCGGDKTMLLCDIGTNGEMALLKNGRLYVTSAAAGPAFEGGEISCGCLNIAGAVNKVKIENGSLTAETVGNAKAVGINGTGLIDAVACFLEMNYIDKTGYIERPLKLSANGNEIELTQDDIRALQLAKAAVFAGIETLLESTETDIGSVDGLIIAGSFGSNLSISSAVRIGLIPKELETKTKCIGNAAIKGAAMLLTDESVIKKAEDIARNSTHIQLGGSEEFYNRFISAIDFE